MSDRFCWNCSHSFNYHNRIEGACTFGDDSDDSAARCDCEQYEDAEHLGHQRKRDLYTLSDRRRLKARRAEKQ